jgi:hypothetical protein
MTLLRLVQLISHARAVAWRRAVSPSPGPARYGSRFRARWPQSALPASDGCRPARAIWIRETETAPERIVPAVEMCVALWQVVSQTWPPCSAQLWMQHVTRFKCTTEARRFEAAMILYRLMRSRLRRPPGRWRVTSPPRRPTSRRARPTGARGKGRTGRPISRRTSSAVRCVPCGRFAG